MRGGAGVGWGCPRKGCSSNLGVGQWVNRGLPDWFQTPERVFR